MTNELRDVANFFISKAAANKEPMHITKLLNLCYIAHGWHLETKGKPLFEDRIEAWSNGPVIVNLYHIARKFTTADGYITRTLP